MRVWLPRAASHQCLAATGPDDYEEPFSPAEWQTACWLVIDTYFIEKGLVRQQLDSFNEFIDITMQHVVKTCPSITVEAQAQHHAGEVVPQVCHVAQLPARAHRLPQAKYSLSFDQLYVVKPTFHEPVCRFDCRPAATHCGSQDGQQKLIVPNEARLRNLTYDCQIMVDAKLTVEDTVRNTVREIPVEKAFLGRVPIMLRSKFCVLNEKEMSPADMYNFKECPLDVGGYFVVNGTEKVIIAQERMAANNVYVFERKEAKYLFVAEIRSVIENSSRPPSTMLVKMLRGSGKGRSSMGQVMRVTIPYIKQEIPIMILFRALGFVTDRDILEHIIYDFEDQEMMELLKPSLEESIVIQEQQV